MHIRTDVDVGYGIRKFVCIFEALSFIRSGVLVTYSFC